MPAQLVPALLEELPRVGAVADVYNAQQHVHYGAWKLKKRGERREGVSSRSAAFRMYAAYCSVSKIGAEGMHYFAA